jgi:F0F1-type ATP synthase membrane subunit b/b'
MKIISLLLLTGSVFASSKGGHVGHVSDLVAPAVNFFILTGFLILKLKGPMANMFTKKAETIAETLERASVKSKEAQVMLETQNKKLNNLESEIKLINDLGAKEVKNFSVKYGEEIIYKSEKLKVDAAAKIEAERKALLEKVNTKLIDGVITKTAAIVKANNELRSKVNNKMVQEIK